MNSDPFLSLKDRSLFYFWHLEMTLVSVTSEVKMEKRGNPSTLFILESGSMHTSFLLSIVYRSCKRFSYFCSFTSYVSFGLYWYYSGYLENSLSISQREDGICYEFISNLSYLSKEGFTVSLKLGLFFFWNESLLVSLDRFYYENDNKYLLKFLLN